jgi:hypothetical protein
MELPRACDDAIKSGNRVELREANSQYQELVLQWAKAKKRAAAGGSTAGGDVAACRLLVEYCDLQPHVQGAPRAVAPLLVHFKGRI